MPDKVLVLHESETDKNYAGDELLARGFEVITITTAEQAIVTLKRTGQFSLIVAPVHLLTGDVFDLLRWVRGDNKHKHESFLFLCIAPTDFTKGLARGIEAAAHILGADEVMIEDSFKPAQFWSLVEPLLSRKKDALDERETSLDEREQDIEKKEAGLESRDKFMQRREHRDDESEQEERKGDG